MNAVSFANACHQEKEQQVEQYMNSTETEVGTLVSRLQLSQEQKEILKELLDTALTDAYITLLYALDGAASLGDTQMEFKLYDEDGNLVSDGGNLEAAAYEAFYENKD